MGSGGSKPEQHIFNADAPVRFSQGVLESLQNSPESDSTRAQDAELKIQKRVNEELKKVRDRQAQQLTDLTASLTTDPPKQSEGSLASEPQRDPTSLAYHLSSPFYQDHSTAAGPAAAPKREMERSHDSVHTEVMGLRQKLESRRKVDKLPEQVEKARDEVVRCLRVNDRRPLDCWQEVERFKAEVSKLEQAYISRVGR